jgi:hypothetical protein
MDTKTHSSKPKASLPAEPAKKVQADWERIELDYRAGIKTLRQIAEAHGITHGAINKRAKRDGWERDLKAKIQQKADALVSRAAVAKKVSKESKIAERDVIETNASAVAEVRLSHRHDIQRSRRITMALLEELEGQTGADTVALLYGLGDMMRNPDKHGQDKLNDLYHKIISLPGRAKTMKDLGESLRVLVALERQAFGLDDKEDGAEDPLTALLKSIQSSGSSLRPIAQDPEYGEPAASNAFPISGDSGGDED